MSSHEPQDHPTTEHVWVCNDGTPITSQDPIVDHSECDEGNTVRDDCHGYPPQPVMPSECGPFVPPTEVYTETTTPKPCDDYCIADTGAASTFFLAFGLALLMTGLLLVILVKTYGDG